MIDCVGYVVMCMYVVGWFVWVWVVEGSNGVGWFLV